MDQPAQLGTGPDDSVYDFEFDAQNRVLIAGRFDNVDGVSRRGLARLLANGALDTSFSPNIDNDTARLVKIASDGKILVLKTPGGASSPPLRRLLANGSPDPSFVLDPLFNGGKAADLIVQQDGSLLVVGLEGPNGINRAALRRIQPNGAVDPNLVVEQVSGVDQPNAVAVLPGGRYLIAGGWTAASANGAGGLVMLEPVPAPEIAAQPQPATVPAGGGVELAVTATNDLPTTYQWRHNGAAIAGATDARLAFPVAQTFHAGTYSVAITNAVGTTISHAVTLTVSAATPSTSRLLNVSTRSLVQTGDNVLIPGFVIAGNTSKKLLIRAVGPTLGQAPFNIPGVLPDPRITLKRRDTSTGAFVDLAVNDDWGTNTNFAELKQTAADLFAFGIPDASKDAAMLLDLQPGEYTVIARDGADASGIAIVELYDADANGAGSRLINISNRGFVGVGANIMIPGFVVSSEGPKTFLIRAVGPTLGTFGVGGTMADPKLTVYRSNSPQPGDTEILNQDDWGANPDAAYTAQIAQQVQAFSLGAGSKDAAFVVTLPPGLYTVHGKSADGVGTGVVLVEVYVVE